MHPGVEYLNSKRLSIMAISTSQFILGLLCILFWTASTQYCRYCYDSHGFDWSQFCQWTAPLQGVWGGIFALLCGSIGVVRACKTSIAGNSSHIAASVLSLLTSSAMVALEILLITDNVIFDGTADFKEHCLPEEGIIIWKYFHYTLIGMGGLCFILSIPSCIMTSYAQCGCCGTHCDTEADYEYLRNDGISYEERFAPPRHNEVRVQACVHHSCNCELPAHQQERFQQHEVVHAQEPRRYVPIDDILRMDAENEGEGGDDNLIQLEDEPETRENTSGRTQISENAQDHQDPTEPPPPYTIT
ncbi:uncharacterized protein LOC120345971 [Styela clava]